MKTIKGLSSVICINILFTMKKNGTSQSGMWNTASASGYYGANSLYSKDGTYTFAAD